MRMMPRILGTLAGIVAVLLMLGAVWVRSVMHAPLGNSVSETFTVESGASAAAVANRLQERGFLQQPRVFTLWARLSGDAGRLKAGEYQIEAGTTAAGLLSQLVEGNVQLYPVTLLEGWTWRDLRDALQASDVLTLTLPYESAEALAAALELKWPHVEGQLFPDTYKVPRGSSDSELLRQAAALMQEELAAAWAARASDLPLQDPYELLTLASIIERETSLDAERPQVAGVFVRRLQKRMRLQTDPTVIYGLGDSFDGNLTRKHLQTDTPYNTYTRGGLPPTPISMPGAASLRAAANPAAGDTLFFVASSELDGSHVFSVTLEEHNAAVAAYIASLRRARQ